MKVAILGLGLMGGSLGLALRKRRIARVVAYARREETRRAALALGAADELFAAPEEAARDADVVVICTPILAVGDLLRQCAPVLSPGALVTDVGSTKAEIVAAADAALSGHPSGFVGSHPMCGSEQSGLEAADEALDDGATVVLTPGATSNPDAVATVTTLWEALGAKVVLMDADAHDRVVARTSHLPHFVAAALALHILGEADDTILQLCGTGMRDTTRVAAGPEDVWHDIFRSNPHLLGEIGGVIEALQEMRAMLSEGRHGDLRDVLNDARALRQSL